jgi:hypothetical protein
MPRDISMAMDAAIAAGSIFPAIFVMATFKTGPVYLWTGLGSVVWNGNTWLGIGTLGKVSTIEEGSTVQARGITLSLSGIDPAWLSNVLSEYQLGAAVAAYVGFFGGSPLALLATPVPIWVGRMDQPTIDMQAATASISINCENRRVEMKNSVQRRRTNDDQQLVAPGDLGLAFVAGIQERQIYWGAVNSNPLNQ